MKFTVKGMELYDSMGFALLTISLAMEYYRRGLELCGGGAPGVAAALAIAMLIKSWVDENKWRRDISNDLFVAGEIDHRHHSNPNHTVAMPISDSPYL